jgi:hypothetical protein
MPLPRKARWDRSRPRLVAESLSKLPSGLNTWEINHTAGAVVSVLLGQAADVYARIIQCKVPFRMVLFIKHVVA